MSVEVRLILLKFHVFFSRILPFARPSPLCNCVYVCECIPGAKGTKITMVFKRFAQDKVDKFSVALIRGTAARLNN